MFHDDKNFDDDGGSDSNSRSYKLSLHRKIEAPKMPKNIPFINISSDSQVYVRIK